MRFLKFWQESNQDTRQTIYSNEFQRANRHVFALSYMYFYMFIIMCIQYYYSHKGLNFIVSMLKSTKKVRCVQHGISKINMYVLSIAPVLFGYGYREHCRDLGLCRMRFCVSTCTGAPLPAPTLNQRQCAQDPCLSFLCVVTWYSHLKYSTTAAYGSDFPVHIVNCRRLSAMLF